MTTISRRLLLGAAAVAPLGLAACSGDDEPIRRDPIACAQGGNAMPQDMAPPDPENLISPNLTFSGDRSEVAAIHGTSIIVWSTTTGRIVRSTGPSRLTYNWGILAWNPQEPMLARDSCAAQVQFLDANDWARRGMLTGHTETEAIPMMLGLQHFTFSPDGETVASCAHDGLVKLWRVSDQAELRSIASERSDGVQHLAFCPDGVRVLGSSLNHPPVVWDVASGEEVAVLDQVEQAIKPTWSPDGTLLAFSDWNGRLHLHDGESLAPLQVLEFSVRPEETAWTADGSHIAMTTEDADEIAVWQVDSSEVETFECPGVDRVHPAADPDEFHTASVTHGIQTWTLGDPTPRLQFELPTWES